MTNGGIIFGTINIIRNSMKLLMFLLTLFCFSSATSAQKGKKILLAVFAHPDDELAIAPALSKLAKEYVIYTVYATDGKGGTRIKNIAPDTLGMMRVGEAICSLAKLGLEPPIFLHVDRMDSKYNLRTFWNQTKIAKDSLMNIVQRINPHAIITMGPDGDTGHPEHRVVSSLVTELLLREGWVERYPLYFLLWTKKQADQFADGMDELMYASDQYINLTVKYTREDQQKAWDAARCHQSQFTDEEIEKAILIDKKGSIMATYFRRFKVDKTKCKEF